MNKAKKITNNEICYFCGRKFDMNNNDRSYYRYKKYPVCDDCSNSYGFY